VSGRTTHSDETKAAVLADVVLIGAGAAAAKHGISVNTVKTWKLRSRAGSAVEPLKKERIGEMVAAYLEANLQALTAQAYVASDPQYIEKQPAESLAVLHGVMADKSIRLLEALGRSGSSREITDTQ
jgi:transposase-like protein